MCTVPVVEHSITEEEAIVGRPKIWDRVVKESKLQSDEENSSLGVEDLQFEGLHVDDKSDTSSSASFEDVKDSFEDFDDGMARLSLEDCMVR